MSTDRSPIPPGPRRTAALLYAMSAGVAWWVVHLVGLAAVTPAVCGGLNQLVFTALNLVCIAGVLSALVVSQRLRHIGGAGRPSGSEDGPPDHGGRAVGYLATIALLFNLASLAVVILESIPVYVLGPC